MQGRTNSIGFGVMMVVLLGAVTCGARPSRSDSSYGDILQDGGHLDGLGNGLGGGLGRVEGAGHLMQSAPEDSALAAALQMQLIQQYANYNNARSLPWEQFLRAPQDKRQIRYRQCYFNPISCFRK